MAREPQRPAILYRCDLPQCVNGAAGCAWLEWWQLCTRKRVWRDRKRPPKVALKRLGTRTGQRFTARNAAGVTALSTKYLQKQSIVSDLHGPSTLAPGQ